MARYLAQQINTEIREATAPFALAVRLGGGGVPRG